MFALPGMTNAFVVQGDTTLLIDESVDDNLIAAGTNVSLTSLVNGDTVALGQTVTISGDIYEDLWVA